MSKHAVLSLSGGMDSSSLLLNLLSRGMEITALSFDYGQKHKEELYKAVSLVYYVNQHTNGKVTHRVIELKGLSSLLDSSLVDGGKEVPEGHYAEENMKSTVVPNRNKIFASIIQAAALSIAQKNNCEVDIAMGIHAGDHAIYPDCRQEFRDADFEAFQIGNWGASKVRMVTPYLDADKYDILRDGLYSCTSLGLDFDEVYKRTMTSYKPIEIDGKYFSDYKSGSSVERVEAFIKLGRPDPAPYADETGPVSWETVKNHVIKVLN